MLTYLSTVPSYGVKIITLAELFKISKESVSKILETLEKALVIKGIEHTGRNKLNSNYIPIPLFLLAV